MGRKVFFSFHYERDIWRVNQVRNSWMTYGTQQEAGFWDESLWERTKLSGDQSIRKLIDNGLQGTTVTVVLIGAETYLRKWVDYEIQSSITRGNGLVGIYINMCQNRECQMDYRGQNPLEKYYIFLDSKLHQPSIWYKTYDWMTDNGYLNLGSWVDEAAIIAGK
ncbi:MAG: TIR-like domain-containing protein [Anaerolinea sp.]|nr:TIR-like domain-containing protein [Anaerolinea sp.]